MWRGKKLVVRVAQRVAPLIPVQWLPSFFPNMYCLFDTSSTFARFSVQNSGGRPIDHVVVMRCMVSQCWFVLLMTDHASHDNHEINWPASTIMDRKSDFSTFVLDGSKRQYIFGKKDGSHWTGTRGATRWATRTTDFLPCRITIVERTGRGIAQTSSDEGLW